VYTEGGQFRLDIVFTYPGSLGGGGGGGGGVGGVGGGGVGGGGGGGGGGVHVKGIFFEVFTRYKYVVRRNNKSIDRYCWGKSKFSRWGKELGNGKEGERGREVLAKGGGEFTK